MKDKDSTPSLRVGFKGNRIEKFLFKDKFCVRFTGSRYIFLRFAAKNTRTDGFITIVVILPSVLLR